MLCAELHFNMWNEYISDITESADLQSCFSVVFWSNYILFNSTTSWQIRDCFKFRSKTQQIWCAWWQSREVLLKWAIHEWSRMQTQLLFESFSPFLTLWLCWGMHLHMQCRYYANECAHSHSKNSATFTHTHEQVIQCLRSLPQQ